MWKKEEMVSKDGWSRGYEGGKSKIKGRVVKLGSDHRLEC